MTHGNERLQLAFMALQPRVIRLLLVIDNSLVRKCVIETSEQWISNDNKLDQEPAPAYHEAAAEGRTFSFDDDSCQAGNRIRH